MTTLLLNLVGVSVFVGSLAMVWTANARRWNRLALPYCDDRPPIDSTLRQMQSLVLVGGGIAFNSYKGIVTVGISSDGISLRLFAPFSVFHPPLLIPYQDIQVEPTSWYLNCSSFRYSFAAVDDVEMIVDDTLKDWIDREVGRLASGTLASSPS
ncbi:MAG: hypothetical protein AAGD11_05305 [Planctomycetota bacterium]